MADNTANQAPTGPLPANYVTVNPAPANQAPAGRVPSLPAIWIGDLFQDGFVYFAYGANMSSWQMIDRCPGAISLGLGHLSHWTWFIDELGNSNIRYTPQEGNEIHVRPSPESPGVYGRL